jgi:hypothetical protein
MSAGKELKQASARKFLTLSFALLTMVCVNLQAQSVMNPGFMGKTSALGLGTQVSGGWYGGFKTQALLTAVAEKSMSRQHSITLRATVGMLNVPFEPMGLSVDGPGSGATANYYGQLTFGNPPALYTRSWGAQWKRYILNRGAIAPCGMYMTVGGERRTVSARDSFSQLVFIEDNYNDPGASLRYTMPTVMPRTAKAFNVLVGIGNKRFVDESIFIDYQFGMTWLFWSNTNMYVSNWDNGAVGPGYNAQNNVELQMRQTDTRRQLFTLNLTAGMVF